MVSCQNESNQKQKPPLELVSVEDLDFLSNASALSILEEKHYVSQSNTPFINVLQSDSLSDAFYVSHQNEDWKPSPKGQSLELSASEIVKFQGQSFVLVLGSGVEGEMADSAFIIDPVSKRSVFTKSMRSLYDSIVSELGCDNIRITGLGITENAVMLLLHDKEANNYIVQVDRKAYFRYLTGVADILPHHQSLQINLPSNERFNQVFSGAEYLASANTLMFSSTSHEEGADGLTSFIGFIPLHQPENIRIFEVPRVTDEAVIELHAIALEDPNAGAGSLIVAYGKQGKSKDRMYKFRINGK